MNEEAEALERFEQGRWAIVRDEETGTTWQVISWDCGNEHGGPDQPLWHGVIIGLGDNGEGATVLLSNDLWPSAEHAVAANLARVDGMLATSR